MTEKELCEVREGIGRLYVAAENVFDKCDDPVMCGEVLSIREGVRRMRERYTELREAFVYEVRS